MLTQWRLQQLAAGVRCVSIQCFRTNVGPNFRLNSQGSCVIRTKATAEIVTSSPAMWENLHPISNSVNPALKRLKAIGGGAAGLQYPIFSLSTYPLITWLKTLPCLVAK